MILEVLSSFSLRKMTNMQSMKMPMPHSPILFSYLDPDLDCKYDEHIAHALRETHKYTTAVL